MSGPSTARCCGNEPSYTIHYRLGMADPPRFLKEQERIDVCNGCLRRLACFRTGILRVYEHGSKKDITSSIVGGLEAAGMIPGGRHPKPAAGGGAG